MNSAIVVAAGQGSRMRLEYNKAFAPLCGKTLLYRSLFAMLSFPEVHSLVLVVSPGEEAAARKEIDRLPDFGKSIAVTQGGATRRASVANGLAAVPPDAEYVLVHDAARPLVSPEVIRAALEGARQCGCAAPGIPVTDTIKQVQDSRVTATPDRAALRAVQTPQVFHRDLLEHAHAWAEKHAPDATDDTLLVEALGSPVLITPGDPRNLKITSPQDLLLARTLLQGEENIMRIGTGYDVHKLVEGRDLILLGESIPFEKGLLGHSDADVAAHALSDALLGAAGLGDIGRHFPDTDPRYKGADSMHLLAEVVAKLAEAGYKLCNVDVTIVAQRPKLAPYLPQMRTRAAQVLGLSEGFVNIKATTTEGLGFEGEGLGISAQAAACIAALHP